MSDFQLGVLGLLFVLNLMLIGIAWSLGMINQKLKALRDSKIAIAATTHTLMKEHTSELQRARLRAR